MKCHCCQAENEADARFCDNCGARLEKVCPSCGTAAGAGKKFCRACGAPLPAEPERATSPQSYTPAHLAAQILDGRASLEGERKQVTVLFADLKGSMELLADRDPEDARRILDPVLERMMEAVHHYEGTVNQVMGDGIMALFGAPLAHEDHAVRACYAALRMQEAIRRYTEEVRRTHGVEVQIRVGLNSGEVVVRSIGSDLRMDYTAVGQTTHLAARMEQLATPGTIRLTGATLALAEGYVDVKLLGPVPVKGLAAPIEAFELAGAGQVRTRLQASRARGFTQFVGRDAEMTELKRAAEEAKNGRGQLAAVMGEPGVGKSRLYYEFIRSHHAHGWRVLEAGSVSYGKATAYLPLADLLRVYFGIETRDDVRAIRAKVTGNVMTLDEALKDTIAPVLWLLDALPADHPFLAIDPVERRRTTLASVKALLLRECRMQPLAVVFEDLHWIDTETQAFLDSFVDSLPAVPILLAVNYRPEYRHQWSSKTYYRQLRIAPLAEIGAADFLNALLGNDASVAPLKPLLVARTQGNPLFLEESVRALADSGALTGATGAYRLAARPESLQVPATVQAILAARIDRLAAREKRLLQAAAVVGTHVPFALLREIAELKDDELRASLGLLQAGEFLFEAQLFPDLEYAFKHALTHEVSYGSVLQERRQALHAAIVGAIERLYPDRLAEQIERLAHHAARGGIPATAVRYLKDAGAKAAGGSANHAAIAYFEEALGFIAQMPQTNEALTQALEINMAMGPTLINTKGPFSAEVERVYRRALELVEHLGLDAKRFPALWGLWYVDYTRGNYEPALKSGKQLLATAQHGNDSGQLVEAHHAVWPTLFALGRLQEARGHMENGCRLYDPQRDARHAFLYAGHDPGICARYHRGVTRWVLGEADGGLVDARQALSDAEALAHPMTTVITLWFLAWLQYERGERADAIANLDRMIELGARYGFAPWTVAASALLNVIRQPRVAASAIEQLQQPVNTTHITSWRRVVFLCALADLCVNSGLADEGLRVLEWIEGDNRTALAGPEILRLEGELMLHKNRHNLADAAKRFSAAAALARERGQKSFELRATMSLARVLAEQKSREEARSALARVYASFAEGHDTADLKAAETLLASL